ncbi:MAG: hypothetical protein GF372_02110 [Candidatus Marinimicrobia bacterium]|nr:hypothetical protein [Candidatus Neomarinimicrobiota bacterium]
MDPTINHTQFGSITIEDTQYNHDVIILPDGSIRERNKDLSRKHFGTSHHVSEEEAEDFSSQNADHLIVGTGQSGQLSLTDEAEQFLRDQGFDKIEQYPTPEAIQHWNEADGILEGLFHVTC